VHPAGPADRARGRRHQGRRAGPGRDGTPVSISGRHTQTIGVSGIPRLYTLYQAATANTGTLLLTASPGVQAYDFTFG
jgi:Thioredoxin like C-terminal domain